MAGGIMSMFSNVFSGGGGGDKSGVSSNPTPNSGAPGNLPKDASATGATPNGAAPNGQIPPNSNTSGELNPDGTPKEATPFAEFADLWQPNKTDPNAPAPQVGVFGEIDPKKFMEAAGKIDFSKVVTPEMLTAISTGGEAATAAFAQAMNKVAQGVYAQSAFATTKIVEQALSKSKESFLAELPQHIKRENVSGSLRAENPIFSNPAVQPIISALEAQMTVKYPNASAGEITAMAKQYVEALGTSFAPKPKVTAADQKKANRETDWSTFLEQ